MRQFRIRSKNFYVKLAQISKWRDQDFSLELAKLTVIYKIRAQLEILKKRRRGVSLADPTLKSIIQNLEETINKITEVQSTAELRGIEGTAARNYFSYWDNLLPKQLGFEKRSKRPALNEVNSALNFSYTLLLNEINSLLESYGLDTMLGYYHGIRYGRISLSLDVMEVYRPLLVDQWIIQLIRTNKLVKKDFHLLEEKGIYLTKEGRKKFMHLYQKWHQQIQYRKMIEEGVIGVRKAYMKGDVRILEKTYKKILHYLL